MQTTRRSDLGWLIAADTGALEALYAVVADEPGVFLVDVVGVECYLDPALGIADAWTVREVDRDATQQTLIDCADGALAEAIQRSRRIAIHGNARMSEIRRDYQLAVALARGSAADVIPVYQPIMRIADQQITGFETLMRWRRDGETLLGPAEFMDVAESTSLIVKMGRTVLGQGIRALDADISTRHGDDVMLTVNLSHRELLAEGTVDFLYRTAGEAGVDTGRIGLEIVENDAIDLRSPARRAVQDLSALGFRIIVDDLGAGYSALSYLRDLPVNAVKIDRSIVSRTPDSDVDRRLCTAIRSMSEALGISTVAEGVETKEICDVIGDLGFEYGQGYYLGMPEGAETLFG
ncbi:EAL domain-containing protein [Gordonia alkaliphila]|uniref:EAL domain-containing protein n=1 Tax=Gordonia alkaliphila TaxID=1053547 RepID=UPI001FF1CC76|nr:EAL domain-containing protein [Gordonia alkaliphila]MCK0438372.1 EAL domain-containing protein [Gordonia alkaliphila]